MKNEKLEATATALTDEQLAQVTGGMSPQEEEKDSIISDSSDSSHKRVIGNCSLSAYLKSEKCTLKLFDEPFNSLCKTCPYN